MKRYTISKLKNSNTNLLDRIYRLRNKTKALDVFTGLCLGIISDGETNEREIQFFYDWINANDDMLPKLLVQKILPILRELKADPVTEDALNQFGVLILHHCLNFSDDPDDDVPFEVPHTAPSFIFDSMPEISLSELQKMEIIFTGEFNDDSRRQTEVRLAKMGMKLKKSPSSHTNIVVVGTNGSKYWSNAQMGNKLKKALELKEKKIKLVIVKETDFIAKLDELLEMIQP